MLPSLSSYGLFHSERTSLVFVHCILFYLYLSKDMLSELKLVLLNVDALMTINYRPISTTSIQSKLPVF